MAGLTTSTGANPSAKEVGRGHTMPLCPTTPDGEGSRNVSSAPIAASRYQQGLSTLPMPQHRVVSLRTRRLPTIQGARPLSAHPCWPLRHHRSHRLSPINDSGRYIDDLNGELPFLSYLSRMSMLPAAPTPASANEARLIRTIHLRTLNRGSEAGLPT